MGATAAVHPTDKVLQAYGLGTLDADSSESVSRHLHDCVGCQRRLAELSSDGSRGRPRAAHRQPGSSGPVVSSLAGLSALDASSTSPAPAAIGTLPPGLAGHPGYEVIRELGQGGMGTVYLAQNRLMGRHEVLKVVSSHMMDRRGALDRFLGEIRNAARLHHTNIVTAYSASRVGESIVFAMEYVEGLDLSKLVKAKGPLPIANACNYVHQAALGLQHAHEHGMVHRDIKPSNLMLARHGSRAAIKVLDFGLAKVKSEGAVDGGLTHEGQMLGTPDYVAPEQISDARRADIRADIYSLGCTLYYLLTGGPPFHATSLYEILQAHHSMEAMPLNLARPEVPVELAALVARMMAKEPERRFQTPRDVAQALLPFFKKGIAAAARSRAEMSQPDGANEDRASTGPRAVPTLPAMETPPSSATAARQAAERTQPGSILEGLIDVSDRNPLFDPTLDCAAAQAASVAGRQGRHALPSSPAAASGLGRRGVWLIAGALLLGLVVAFAVIIKVKTARGVIVRENAPENAVLEVDGDQITVRPVAGEPVKIETQAGKHDVVVKRGQDVENSIGMTLRLIPAGQFMMGSPADDNDRDLREQPQHRVRISAFYLGLTEVTQAQYEAVMGNNPSHFSATGDGKDKVAGRSTGPFPVERVSWIDAVRFCNTLSKNEGRIAFYEEYEPNKFRVKKGPGYRLPTEAEWEYACRAGSTTRYCFGDDPSLLVDHGWFGRYAAGMTHPVGEKYPNRFGLYDMYGNVREWCSDWFDDAYYQRAPATDPQGPSAGTHRVIRGGSWRNRPLRLRSAERSEAAPVMRGDGLGFRVARGQPDQ